MLIRKKLLQVKREKNAGMLKCKVTNC